MKIPTNIKTEVHRALGNKWDQFEYSQFRRPKSLLNSRADRSKLMFVLPQKPLLLPKAKQSNLPAYAYSPLFLANYEQRRRMPSTMNWRKTIFSTLRLTSNTEKKEKTQPILIKITNTPTTTRITTTGT